MTLYLYKYMVSLGTTDVQDTQTWRDYNSINITDVSCDPPLLEEEMNTHTPPPPPLSPPPSDWMGSL